MSEAPRQDCPSPTHSEFVLDPSTLQAVDSAQELVHSNSLSLSQGGSHNSSGLFWNYSGSGMFAGSMLPSHPDGIAAPILANMDQSGFWSSGPSSAAHKHQRRHSPRFVTSPVHQISRSTSQRLSSMVDPQIEDGSRNSNTSASNSFLPNSTSNTMYPRAVPCVSASSTTVSSNQSFTPVNIPCIPPPQPANYMLISPQAPPTIYVAYHSPLPMVSPVESVVPIPAMGALTTTSIGSENVTLSYDGNKTLSAQNRASSAKGLTPPLFLSSPATATPESGGSLVVDTDGSNQNMPQHPGMLGPRHLMKTPPEDQMIDSSSLVVGSERRTPQSSHGQLPGLVSSIGWPHAQPVTASGWFTSASQTNVKSPSDVEAIDRAHLFSSDSSDDGTEAFESGHRPMGYQPPAARRRSTCSSLREIPHASLKK